MMVVVVIVVVTSDYSGDGLCDDVVGYNKAGGSDDPEMMAKIVVVN